MEQTNRLSNVTKEYAAAFYCILDEMIQGMTSAKLTDSISYNFIAQMIPHHRAAIEMCRNLLKYTTCLPLQDIALGIIEEQTRSIENMQQISSNCRHCQNCRQEVACYQARVDDILNTMFTSMQNACTVNDINVTFMREMIPHHEGAVRMCKNALKYNLCPGLIPILNAIISSQERGICQMKELLCSLGYPYAG